MKKRISKKASISLAFILMLFGFFALGVYFGGYLYLSLTNIPQQYLSYHLVYDQWITYHDDKNIQPYLYVSIALTIIITFLPALIFIFAVFKGNKEEIYVFINGLAWLCEFK